MMRWVGLGWILTWSTLLGGTRATADEPVKSIRALLITGGCCHDYQKQKSILTQGISARAPVEWTIVHQGGSTTDTKIAVYENADWSKGFDIVVHNECFAGVTDPAWTERILKPHREGLPAIVIHCAMHCYRDKTDEWFKFLGVTSHGHGANYPFEVVNLAKSNPIMEGFGATWQTPKGELYLISKIWDTCTPLAHAMSRDSKKNEVCIWTNTYGKARVFGTTIGHHNEEMLDPVYLNYVTRGLLWAVDKLDPVHLKPLASVKKVLVPENLAKGKKASASGSQSGHDPAHAVDGNLETRWCAPNDQTGDSWQVDLGQPEELTGVRITWEGNAVYRYKVEGSADGKTWTMLSDQTRTEDTDQEQLLSFKAKGVRHVRVTTTGLATGHWASFFEVEVYGTKMTEVAANSVALARLRSINGKGVLAGIKAPEGFKVTMFAEPPLVRYPTCVTAAPTGEVFVGIDENGSIDAKPKRGRVLRLIDGDGDGKADRSTVFAEMDSPRGLVFDNGTLYVLHPPDLTAYHDDNGDGVSDRSEDLVKDIGFSLKYRGADHTTNGIQLGIDGFLYVAVGDYGFVKAVGKDGASLQLHGGGIARVRTDGSGLELYSRGQRNIYDVAIDPYMNLFTRDNTNDGGGWDVRLSHLVATASMGYPSLFTNFPDEIVQPLADYGGGSPCGSLYVQEPGLPPGFGDALYTCEWGRSAVFRHPLQANGAGFTAGQEPFLELPRPTDMAIDGQGRIYVTSWKDGGFTFDKPNVGYLIQVTYEGNTTPPFPDLKAATDAQLLEYLASPSQVKRLHTQREILRRGQSFDILKGLASLATSDRPLAARAAAIFTLAQMLGKHASGPLSHLAKNDAIREFALRALADRKADAAAITAGPFVDALTDPNPRVRLQAVVGLGRLGKVEAAGKIVALTADADPLVAHVAVKSLVALKAVDPCLKALDPATPKLIPGAARALQAMHDPRVVDGLIAKLDVSGDDTLRRAVLKALCRLYYREADWNGKWWGTRPDTSGPYFQHERWEQTDEIDKALRAALKRADEPTARWLLPELIKHKIDFEEETPLALKLATESASLRKTAVNLLLARAVLGPPAIAFLKDIASSEGNDPVLRARCVRGLERLADQPEVLAALVAALAPIGAQEHPQNDLRGAWLDFLRDGRHAKNVAVFVKLASDSDPARGALAYAALIHIADQQNAPAEARSTARKAIDDAWKSPETAARLLGAIGQTRATVYALLVRARLNDANPAIKQAAAVAFKQLENDRPATKFANAGPLISKLAFEQAYTQVQKAKGDLAVGRQLFERQGCLACHTLTKNEVLKGPYLGDIATRYNRAELAESILRPSAKIAQGFETQKFATISGQVIEGFVVRESGDEVELRNAAGSVCVLPKKEIDERGKSDVSVMPNGLADPLTVPELASILDYLQSLNTK